jgi:hypothetical protein
MYDVRWNISLDFIFSWWKVDWFMIVSRLKFDWNILAASIEIILSLNALNRWIIFRSWQTDRQQILRLHFICQAKIIYKKGEIPLQISIRWNISLHFSFFLDGMLIGSWLIKTQWLFSDWKLMEISRSTSQESIYR